jgi:hypothetical protein
MLPLLPTGFIEPRPDRDLLRPFCCGVIFASMAPHAETALKHIWNRILARTRIQQKRSEGFRKKITKFN